MKRRHFLQLGGMGLAGSARPLRAQQLMPLQDLLPLIRAVAGEVQPRPGRVRLGLPQLAENGNSVPLELNVDSPMTEADHVRSLHVFAERNPRPLIASFHLGPHAGRAKVTTRIRLAGSQRVVAIAVLSDGSAWSDETEVIVTSAACLDEMSL
ncbi:MAG: sulfur oxidation protein SoxY [Rhodocyclales bacterium]|nr:sulfur oxidation protein SoxY [Rhodocyclales bacterium]